MSADTASASQMEARFEELFKEEYSSLLNYAKALLRTRGLQPYHALAEEAVQQLFLVAWQKRDDLFASPNPIGWLYCSQKFIILRILRSEFRRLDSIPLSDELDQAPSEEFNESLFLELELMKWISKEDFILLEKLYVEGYTYHEMAEATNMNGSAFAMKISRMKKKLREKLGRPPK